MPAYYRDIYDSHEEEDGQGDDKKDKTLKPTLCRRFLRVCTWLLVVNVWTVLLFTKRHFSDIQSLALAQLEGVGTTVSLAPNNAIDESIKTETRTAVKDQNKQQMTKVGSEALQRRGQMALEELEDHHVFYTPITSQASVLERGFPQPWKQSCTMQDALVKAAIEDIPLKIVVLGSQNSRGGAESDCEDELEDMPQLASTESSPFSAAAVPPSSSEMNHDVLTALLQNDLNTFLNQDLRSNLSFQLDVEVVNMGQHTSMTPMVQALLLDQVLNPVDTDLIIWQPSLMMLNNKDLQEHKQEMKLFLARIAALFRQAGRRPPPVLAVHFDDLLVETGHKTGVLIQHLWQSLLAPEQPTYASTVHRDDDDEEEEEEEDNLDGRPDWNVQVVNVGATVASSASFAEKDYLMDANHKVTCHGVQLMAHMIQYAIYKDLATCVPKNNVTSTTDSSNNEMIGQNNQEQASAPYVAAAPAVTSGNAAPKFYIDDEDVLSRNTTLPLSRLLYRDDISVRSHSHWLPNLHDTASSSTTSSSSGRSSVSLYGLEISNMTEPMTYLEQVPTMPTIGANMAPALVAHQLADKRISYRLPLCSSRQFANFTVAEPHLEWLGLVYKGGRVKCSINGQPLHLEHLGQEVSGLRGVRDWIHVAHWVEASPTYRVSLCSRRVNKNGLSSVWLHQMVGLMLPASSP